MSYGAMWGSGTQQSGAWGWQPPNSGVYANDEEYDQSQGWAAAAAAWAQQRELRENNEALASAGQPPPPPGPPPMRPPLPTGDTIVTGETPVQVHDYMHGQQQPTEIIDYQHGKAMDPSLQQSFAPQPLMATPVGPPPITTDYNHMSAEGTEEAVTQEWEVTSDNWFDYHPTGQEFYNGGWTADSWHGDQAQYYAAAAQYYQNEYNAHHPAPNANASGKGRKERSADYSSSRHGDRYKHNSSYNSSDKGVTGTQDSTEGTKKTKGLPLWLRQGLEKMEREKKKAEQLKAKKAAAENQETSPRTSEKGDVSEDDDVVMKDANGEDTEEKDLPKSSTDKADKSGATAGTSESEEETEEEEDEIDEETKFREIMMKVKTWMTEILLGVTNKEIKAVCNEVCIEVKRSAKVKATQLRRSGGLDALRSVGEGNATTSESESEDEKDQKKPNSNSMHNKSSNSKSLVTDKTVTVPGSSKADSQPPVKVKQEPGTNLPKSYQNFVPPDRVKIKTEPVSVLPKSYQNSDTSDLPIKIKQEPGTVPSERNKNIPTAYTHVKIKEEPLSSDEEPEMKGRKKDRKSSLLKKTNGVSKDGTTTSISKGKLDIKKEREETEETEETKKATDKETKYPTTGKLDIKIKSEKSSDDEGPSSSVASAAATPTESKEAIAKQIDEIEKQIDLIKNRKANKKVNSIKKEKSRSSSPVSSQPVKVKKEPESPPSRASADEKDRLKYFKMLAEKSKVDESSTSEEDSDSDSSSDTVILTDSDDDDDDDSSDSEHEKRRSSKSKRKRSSKKKSKRHRKDSSSSDDEEVSSSHRKKKRRKASTSSSDDSYYQKKKSSSKKKRSKKSRSKSPSRPKKKR